MKHSTRGYNQYFVIIILLLLGLVFINSCQKNRAEYTRAALIQDLEAGEVTEVIIHQNRETPTGYLDISLKTKGDRTLYATDVKELEAGRVHQARQNDKGARDNRQMVVC